MTVIHKEHTFKQKVRYKKLKPLALTPSIELKNKTFKIQSGGVLRLRDFTVRARRIARTIKRYVLDRAVRIKEAFVGKKKAVDRNNLTEDSLSLSRVNLVETADAVKSTLDRLQEKLSDRGVRTTVEVSTRDSITQKFTDLTRVTDSVVKLAEARQALTELSEKAAILVAKTQAEALRDQGVRDEQTALGSAASISAVAVFNREKAEAGVALQSIQRACQDIIKMTISNIHDGLAITRDIESLVVALKSTLDPIIININNKTKQLNEAILESYLSVDDLVSRTTPILQQINVISRATELLKNKISDLIATRSSLPQDQTLNPTGVTSIEFALGHFTETAGSPPVRSTKDSILGTINSILTSIHTLIFGPDGSLSKITAYSGIISRAQRTVATSSGDKAKLLQSYRESVNGVTTLDPSTKNGLVTIVSSHDIDVGTLPTLTNSLGTESRVNQNDVTFPTRPALESVDSLNARVIALKRLYDSVPIKIIIQLKALFGMLISARNDVNNVEGNVGTAITSRNTAYSQYMITYTTYSGITLVPAPSHLPIDNIENTYKSILDKYLSNIDGVKKTATSDLANFFGSISSYFKWQKTNSSGGKSAKDRAQSLKTGFSREVSTLNPARPDETTRQAGEASLTSARSISSRLVISNLNLGVTLKFLTKLKDEIFIVLTKNNDRFEIDLTYNKTTDTFIGLVRYNNTSKVSSNTDKGYFKSEASKLADTTKENLGPGTSFYQKIRTFLSNFRDIGSLKEKLPAINKSLREAEILLEVGNDVIKLPLLLKLKDIQALKEIVDTAIGKLPTPEPVRPPINTDREDAARQDAFDKLSDKIAELDILLTTLASVKDLNDAHKLEKFILKVIGEIGGIAKVDTRALQAFYTAKETFKTLKASATAAKQEGVTRAEQLKGEPRDTTPATFRPEEKPTNKPDDAELNATKALLDKLKDKLAEIKRDSARGDLAQKIVERWKEIADLTSGYVKRVKETIDPSQREAATSAKIAAKIEAAKLKENTPDINKYRENLEKIRKLKEEVDQTLREINEFRIKKMFFIFDKGGKLDAYRKLLDKLRREQMKLHDAIKTLKDDIRDIEEKLRDPNLDPTIREEFNKLLKEQKKLRDELERRLKKINEMIRDFNDRIDRLRREISWLERLKKILKGIVFTGVSLIPAAIASILAIGAGALGAGVFAPALGGPNTPAQPTQTPTTTNQSDYLKGKADGCNDGTKAGAKKGAEDGLKEAQDQYAAWVAINPEERGQINVGDGSDQANQQDNSEENNSNEDNSNENNSEENISDKDKSNNK